MKKIIQLILLMGLFSFLGCKDKPRRETFKVDGDTVTATTSVEDNYDPKLDDLNAEQQQFINDRLKDAEKLIDKYCGQVVGDKFNSKTLDTALDNWRNDPDLGKNLPEEMIDIIGTAFGQGLVNELDCEWKIITDVYGQNFTVIHKKYFVNGFPFSSVEKAVTETNPRSLNDIKLIMKKNIQDSENNPEIERRQ